MPLHIYECENCAHEFSELKAFGDPVKFADCPECPGVGLKVWRKDTIGSFDAGSAQVHEKYYNEQLGQVVRKGREIEDCQPMVEKARENGRPIALDWK